MSDTVETQQRLDLLEEAAEGSDVPMMPGMYAAISGLEAHQTMLDVTANNLANVNTIGYKAQSADVRRRALAADRRRPAANGFNGGTNPEQVGLGVQVGSIDNIMTAGGVERPATRSTSRSRATASCASPTATPRTHARRRSTRPSTPAPAT